MGRYKENGRWWTSPGVPYVPKTKLEFAKEQKDIALQNLIAAGERLNKASITYDEAKADPFSNTACTCCPQHRPNR